MIIGILAAVTIVAYSGINKRAIDVSLQSDLTSASTKLKLYQVDNMAYPTLINSCPTPSAGNICLKSSPGNTYNYSVVNTSSPQTYSLTEANTNGSTYVVTHDSSPVAIATVAPLVSHPQIFSSTGTTNNYTVPAGVTSVTLEVWGGGDSFGDYGGYAKATLAVSPGDVLVVPLGSHGTYNGGDASIKRLGGTNLVLATEGWDAAGADWDVGYGYTYAGVTAPLTGSGVNPGGAYSIITYTTGG